MRSAVSLILLEALCAVRCWLKRSCSVVVWGGLFKRKYNEEFNDVRLCGSLVNLVTSPGSCPTGLALGSACRVFGYLLMIVELSIYLGVASAIRFRGTCPTRAHSPGRLELPSQLKCAAYNKDEWARPPSGREYRDRWLDRP
jgi:hypothetical protein